MPPRKKIVTKPQVIEETPVVFFLRISEDTIETVTPAEDSSAYSELEKVPAPVDYSSILNSVEISKIAARF
jgi:hypothetical protein